MLQDFVRKYFKGKKKACKIDLQAFLTTGAPVVLRNLLKKMGNPAQLDGIRSDQGVCPVIKDKRQK